MRRNANERASELRPALLRHDRSEALEGIVGKPVHVQGSWEHWAGASGQRPGKRPRWFAAFVKSRHDVLHPFQRMRGFQPLMSERTMIAYP